MADVTEYKYEVMGAISGEAWGEVSVPHLKFRRPPTLEERFERIVREMVAVSEVLPEDRAEPLYVRPLNEDLVSSGLVSGN